MAALDVTVVIGTYGSPDWLGIAENAAASALDQGVEVVLMHGDNLADARNRGAEHVRTEWICFLDADDLLAPGYFDAMAKGTADLRGPSVMYVRDGVPQEPVILNTPDIRTRNCFVIGTPIRKQMFQNTGGFRDLDMYEDWDVILGCIEMGATTEMIPDAVYVANVRTGSRNEPSQETKEFWYHRIRKEHFPELYS